MFAEIDAAFNVAGKPVLFCWGDTVYNPENAAMSYELGARMKIADDFDAIRQRARELAAERNPPTARVPDSSLLVGALTYADSEADVSDHYFPIGMIVA